MGWISRLFTGSELNRALSAAIAEHDLVDAEVVRYPSFDGLPIPALLYRPHGSSSGERAPAPRKRTWNSSRSTCAACP